MLLQTCTGLSMYFSFFEYIPKNRIAGPLGHLMCTLLRIEMSLHIQWSTLNANLSPSLKFQIPWTENLIGPAGGEHLSWCNQLACVVGWRQVGEDGDTGTWSCSITAERFWRK